MPLAVGDFLQAVTYCKLQEQLSLNVWHYQVTSVMGVAPSESDVADAIDSVFGALLKAAMSDQAEYLGASIQKVAPVPAGDRFYNQDSKDNGDVAADALPGQVAGLISLRSGLAGRTNRGRKYISFMPETWNTSIGTPSSFALTALANLGAEYVAPRTVVVGPNSLSLSPVILNLDAETSVAMDTYLVRQKWATQRRRSAINRGDTSPL